MSIVFKKAIRENVPLLIGLSGGTGSGKTFSAMTLAAGLSGGKPFAVIDTESGRARHYADRFTFDHAELAAPFRPDAYVDAITAADKAGYPVVVVDSMSHVWAGDGGVLDWQEEELSRMAGDDYRRREGCKMAAWIKPKMSHKRMVSRLLQLRAHVILCFRAEEKIEMTKDERGKTVITKKETKTGLDGWVPICEKNLPYELTMSFLLTADAPGVPRPIKLEEQHREYFPTGQPVGEAAGAKLAAWSRGDTVAKAIAANAAKSQATAPDALLDEAIFAAQQVGPEKARAGMESLKAYWASLPSAVQVALVNEKNEWKKIAEDIK
jgi:hypothetical protein